MFSSKYTTLLLLSNINKFVGTFDILGGGHPEASAGGPASTNRGARFRYWNASAAGR